MNEIIINANLKLSPIALIRYGKALRKSGLTPDDFILQAVATMIYETLGEDEYEVQLSLIHI